MWAGLKALREPTSPITVASRADSATGRTRAGGQRTVLRRAVSRFSPGGPLRHGLLEICVIPRTNWAALIHCGIGLLTRGRLPESAARSLRSETFTLTSPATTPLEVDGESVGHLPATFSIKPKKLRVIVPGPVNA